MLEVDASQPQAAKQMNAFAEIFTLAASHMAASAAEGGPPAPALWSSTYALPALAALIRADPSTTARARPGNAALLMLKTALRDAFKGSGSTALIEAAQEAGLPAALYDALAADAEADTPAAAARAHVDGADGCIYLLYALTRPNVMNPHDFYPRAPADVVLRFCAAALERLARVKARRARAL
jgi:hypothetical protein